MTFPTPFAHAKVAMEILYMMNFAQSAELSESPIALGMRELARNETSNWNVCP